MLKTIISLLLVAMTAFAANAQSREILNEEIERLGDEVQVDSTLLYRDIFSLMPQGVDIRQSEAIRIAFNQRINNNEATLFNGFRVRIFLDSKLDSREASLAAIRQFNALYPHVLALRSYSAPNFKVSVGAFRTKLEAERFLNEIRGLFPEAFVVRDKFKYPSIGKIAERAMPELEIEL